MEKLTLIGVSQYLPDLFQYLKIVCPSQPIAKVSMEIEPSEKADETIIFCIWVQSTDYLNVNSLAMEEAARREDDPRVGGQWRIATLSRRGKRSPAAVPNYRYISKVRGAATKRL